jgi:ubiquinone/menaquinone biosynthesis C-methylase UbiE
MNEIVQYYNTLAGQYDKDRFNNTYGRYIDAQERKLLDRLLQNPNTIVLDLACGSGRLLNYASIGADASSEMVHIAQSKYPDKKICSSNAHQLPFDDQSVDTIISFHFFMHLDITYVQQTLKECHRILKPGGRIIFDIPSKKRRNLLRHQQQDWHGGFSMTLKEAATVEPELFSLQQSFGLLFFPIHHFPKRIRKYFNAIDTVLAKTFLKEYSSYLVIDYQKK